jgi:hypothetical protein
LVLDISPRTKYLNRGNILAPHHATTLGVACLKRFSKVQTFIKVAAAAAAAAAVATTRSVELWIAELVVR